MTGFVFGGRYPLPDAVRIVGQLQLPAILCNESTALHFAADRTVGVALTAIEHRDEQDSFTFRNGIPDDGIVVANGGARQDRGLWAMRLTTQWGEKVALAARDAQRFAAYAATAADGAPAFLFVWAGMQVPGAPDYDQPGVMVLVSLAAGDDVSRWQAWVARVRGASASIDSLDVPILAVRAPVEPRAGETHFDAQTRARFFLPSILGPLGGLLSTNMPLWVWVLTAAMLRRGAYRARHPNPEQVLQFACICAMDPQQPASYRRILWLGSEDRSGYYKEFDHRAALAVVRQDVEAYCTWSARFVPPFVDALAAAPMPAPTEWRNTLMTPYPAVVGVLRARGDAYWYDACARYREFVARSGIGGPRVRERIAEAIVGRAEVFSASIQVVPPRLRGPALYDRILELHRLWLRVVANPTRSPMTGLAGRRGSRSWRCSPRRRSRRAARASTTARHRDRASSPESSCARSWSKQDSVACTTTCSQGRGRTSRTTRRLPTRASTRPTAGTIGCAARAGRWTSSVTSCARWARAVTVSGAGAASCSARSPRSSSPLTWTASRTAMTGPPAISPWQRRPSTGR